MAENTVKIKNKSKKSLKMRKWREILLKLKICRKKRFSQENGEKNVEFEKIDGV